MLKSVDIEAVISQADLLAVPQEDVKMKQRREVSEEELEKRRKYLQDYRELMEIIEQWMKKEKPEEKESRRGGMFEHLADEMLVKDIAVTGRKCSARKLQMFMTAEILEILPWKTARKSKVYPSKIYEFLSEEKEDIHRTTYNRFKFEKLEECFSPEKNREAAKRLYWVRKEESGARLESIDAKEFEFCRLLEELRAKIRKNMSEYWEKCEDTKDDIPEEDSEVKERQDAYMKYLMAAALYEIYLREFHKRSEGRFTEMKEFIGEEMRTADSFRMLNTRLEELMKKYSENHADEIHREFQNVLMETVKTGKIIEEKQQMLCKMSEVLKVHGFLLAEYEDTLHAVLTIVMFLEKINLMRSDPDRSIDDFLERLISEKETGTFTNPDKNKANCYKEFEQVFRQIFERILDSTNGRYKGNEKFFECIESIFLLGDKKLSWEVQDLILKVESGIGEAMHRYVYDVES